VDPLRTTLAVRSHRSVDNGTPFPSLLIPTPQFTRRRAMASSSSSSSLPPSAPAKAPGACPCLLPLSRKTAAPRPLTFSSAPARRPLAGVRAVAAQQSSAEFDEDQEYEDDDDDGVVDVEAMEDEARRAAADLAERLARELHVGERLLSFWTIPVTSSYVRTARG
jgi:hypothetical protein